MAEARGDAVHAPPAAIETSQSVDAMAAKRTNPDFLNGVPELLVLQLLARRPMHGYELVQTLRGLADASLAFGEGCIYPILHRLEAEQMLKSRREAAAGRERLVYHVTPTGKKRLTASSTAWRRIARAVAEVLQGDGHVAPQVG